MIQPPSRSILFPYTTLFRSVLKIDNQLNVKVTGVYEDLPRNTTLNDMAFIAPWNLYLVFRPDVKAFVNIWGSDSWQIFAQLQRSEEHTSELQSRQYLVCRLL